THYELVAERIRDAVRRPGRPAVALYPSAGAVAAQALRRIGAEPAPSAEPGAGLAVLLGGRVSDMPEAALAYAEGRRLMVATPAH
ncbi:glutamate racemase, partial [Streptomyces sp. SID11233]|nr:glutamate racemase [Streptomyces sp. SID11233]